MSYRVKQERKMAQIPKWLHIEMTKKLKSGELKTAQDLEQYAKGKGFEVNQSTPFTWMKSFRKTGVTNRVMNLGIIDSIVLQPRSIVPTRAPTWEEIQQFVVEALEASVENKKCQEENNQLLNINASLRNENEVLKTEVEMFRDSSNRARIALSRLGKLNEVEDNPKERT